MEERIFVKPARKGMIIRDPKNLAEILPEEGKYVINSIDWMRYIRVGDVIVVKNPEKKGDK